MVRGATRYAHNTLADSPLTVGLGLGFMETREVGTHFPKEEG